MSTSMSVISDGINNYSKCENEDEGKMKEDETFEILRILDLIKNI